MIQGGQSGESGCKEWTGNMLEDWVGKGGWEVAEIASGENGGRKV